MSKKLVLNERPISVRLDQQTNRRLSEIMRIKDIDKSEAIRYSIKLTSAALKDLMADPTIPASKEN